MSNSTVTANTASVGGEINNQSVFLPLMLHRSAVTNNTANYGGGGIFNSNTVALWY